MYRFLTCLLTVVLLAETATAQTTGHTDITSFNNALSMDAVVTTLDFDSLNSGDTITSGTQIDGFEFDFDFSGVLLSVGDSNTTTSTPNYLGTTDADLLQDGDDFSLTFEPSGSFGIQIVTADILEDGDINLAFNGVTLPLVALDIQTTLPDGSFVYFLGITSDVQEDTMAQISTIGGGFFVFNMDDIIRSAEASILFGDVNLDGVVNLLDVDPFIDRLSTGIYQAEADTNGDGVVNLLDVDPFIALLSGG